MDDFELMNAATLRVQTIDRLVRERENLVSELRRVDYKLRRLKLSQVDLKRLGPPLPNLSARNNQGEFIAKLAVSVKDGLFDDGVLGSVATNFSRSWRMLMGHLRLDETNPKRLAAEDALVKLGVSYVKVGNNGRKFFTF